MENLCVKLVIYQNYTKMHGPKNKNKKIYIVLSKSRSQKLF
jgi:hypothetical protein